MKNCFKKAYAAFMRKCFPQYCVKSLTKTGPDATMYLPGTEKELKAIDSLCLSDEQIHARAWSTATRVALLYRKVFALIDRISTSEEYDALIAMADNKTITAAMKAHTPPRTVVLQLLEAKKLDCIDFIEAVPVAFAPLKAYEVLGCAKEEIPSQDTWRWAIAEALVRVGFCEKESESWAVLFMREIMKIPANNLTEATKARFKMFFEEAYSKRDNISDLMSYLCVFFPECYAKVRDGYYLYKDFSSYFLTMFPQVLKYLSAEKKELSTVSTGVLTPENDAFVWLSIGYYRMSDFHIYGSIFYNAKRIKAKVSQSVWEQLEKNLVKYAGKFEEVTTLLEMLKGRYADELHTKLLGFGSEQLLQFFPFKGWSDENATKAVKKLIEAMKFPVKRMSELSPEMQKTALYWLEVAAQKEALQNDWLGFTGTERLFAPVEIYLVQIGDFKYQQMYVEKFAMRDETFAALLQSSAVDCDKKSSLVVKHAQTWGLTEMQYLTLLQSSVREIASRVKKYVKVQEADKATAPVEA